MIDKLEIFKFAKTRDIPISTVDKDYMLRHQLSDLQAFEYYWEQLPELFAWIQRG